MNEADDSSVFYRPTHITFLVSPTRFKVVLKPVAPFMWVVTCGIPHVQGLLHDISSISKSFGLPGLVVKIGSASVVPERNETHLEALVEFPQGLLFQTIKSSLKKALTEQVEEGDKTVYQFVEVDT